MRTRSPIAVAACLACSVLAGQAYAEPLRVYGRAGAALPLGEYQSREFGLGVGAVGGLELPFTPNVGLAAELGAVWLSDGDPPQTSAFADPNSASQFSGALALHWRPWNTTDLATFDGSAGWWGSVSGGLALTGDARRMTTDVAVGYDFFLDEGGSWGIGPMASWLHVFQPDSELRPEDANLMVLGVHAVLDGVERRRSKPPARDFDRDGILDSDDRCPSQAEDKDGFEDDDGCPDEDNDADGVIDAKDRCPAQAEDKDGFQDDDGCPDEDNDADGIPDLKDLCPLVAEDKDGFNDADGCPDEDNDRDGILDPQDLCINEPENKNGYADGDGCPDEDQVRVVGDKIILDEKVHFAVNMDVIRRVSYPLLGRVAKLLAEHPDYIHIEVQGHADKKGDAERNRALSERRAKAVMEFLVAAGIDASRLTYHGYGEEFPLIDKETEWALFMNRRVEFKITRDERAINEALESSQEAAAEQGDAEPSEAVGVDFDAKDQGPEEDPEAPTPSNEEGTW